MGFPIAPLLNSRVSIEIWIKNIDNILFIFEDLELVLNNKFKDNLDLVDYIVISPGINIINTKFKKILFQKGV